MFDKLPSGYRLTDAGEEILEFAEQMEASSTRLETRIFARDQSVRGLLRLTLAPTLATHLLMPDFAEFAHRHPEVEMEILSSDERVNLTNREADIAIRVVHDRNTLPPNLHGLKGPELLEGVYVSRGDIIRCPRGIDQRMATFWGCYRAGGQAAIGLGRLCSEPRYRAFDQVRESRCRESTREGPGF